MFNYYIRTAVNSLKNVPGYVSTIVLTFGITLGALVCMFNLNYLLLYQPLPYPDQERLYISNWAHHDNGRLRFNNAQNIPGLMELYQQADQFEQRAFIKYEEAVLTNDDAKPKLKAGYITPDFLTLLGSQYAVGRGFSAEEGINSNVPVAVISYQLWQSLYQGTPDILSKKMTFNGVSFNIIGVTAKEFIEPQLHETGRNTQVWLPWDFTPLVPGDETDWTMFLIDLYLVAKLNEGQSVSQTEHNMSTLINKRFSEEVTGNAYFENRTISVSLRSFNEVILGDSQSRALLMFAGVLVLMLISAVNIINLILARAANNHRKIVIQIALGAKRKHIFGIIFTEIMLLMFTASILALIVAQLGNNMLFSVAQTQLPRVAELSLNLPTLLFSVSVAIVLATIFSLITSSQINYRELNKTLQASGKGAGLQISSRIRNILIISQVTLSAILISCNVQVFSSAIKAIQAPLGFTTESKTFLDFDLGDLAKASAEERRNYIEAIAKQLKEHNAIESVSLASNAPMARTVNIEWTTAVTSEFGGGVSIGPGIATIDENYIPLVGLPFIAGRNVTAEEVNARDKVAIINESMAAMLSEDDSALGKPFYFTRQKDPYHVVGIVKDLTIPNQLDMPRIYVPMLRAATFMVAYKPNQELTAVQLNQLVSKISSQIYLYDKFSMDEVHELKISMEKISAWVTATLGLLSLFLAAIGVYGVLNYSMTLRQFELGIRIAIGASPKRIMLLICKDTMTPVLIGLTISTAFLLALLSYATNKAWFSVSVELSSFIVPIILISCIAILTAILAVWNVANKPAIYSLRNN
ncbi:ABC transporter permease [Rheinheimera sp. WS51]|uniref:ABC transporter permease n=1 Tax=Rheinheimera sp. WS51 TaxID=3425886 RepID=UPI003D8D26FE